MKKILFSVALFGATILSFGAEPSAFEAGNINLSNPYGLTESEKIVLKNRQSVQDVEAKLNSILERIQGIQSVLEGVGLRMNKLEQRVFALENKIISDRNSSVSKYKTLKEYAEQTRQIQSDNYIKVSKTLKQLSSLIDKNSKSISANKNTQPKSPQDKFSKMKNSDILQEGIKLVNSNKGSEAAQYFEYLISKNYKSATSNFYLGEISYQQKSYSTAIKYYQKSIQLYDKAQYTPKLLYHTAISFDKIGDNASANRFYKALKVGYPESKEAKASPDRN